MNDRPSASPDDAGGSPVDQDEKPSLRDGGLSPVDGASQVDKLPAPSSARSRRPASGNGRAAHGRNGLVGARTFESAKQQQSLNGDTKGLPFDRPAPENTRPRRGPWFITITMALAAFLGLSLLATVLHSLSTRQLDPKGCRMSYMRPSYIKLSEFDTEHTRFATKYSLYLYREQGLNNEKLTGVPVLFIPGNAGSYKQVRPIASEASNHYHNVLRHDAEAREAGVQNLDFFTVDFNEDITAFHGQTLLDQAEYVNEVIRYILSLYMDPDRSPRPSDLPEPTSIVVLGHSMGGVVARTALVTPNYQPDSINTIVTLSAPHSQPPVTFDGQIVQIYDSINTYWRNAHTQELESESPLRDVTLVSVAGGNLDTVVPSDYASVESILPETHGFTVFTTTIPTVWTSMDHLAILWCDQFRKVVTRALYDIMDANRASQTKPRPERMRLFRKWFLTGMEPNAEKASPYQPASTLLTLGDDTSTVVPSGERLVLRELGHDVEPRAYLLTVPPIDTPKSTRFTLLSDTPISHPAGDGGLEVLLCSVFTSQPQEAAGQFSMSADLSGGGTPSARLACKDASHDLITLPPSTTNLGQPFSLDYEQKATPFSYLQYDAEHLFDHEFIVVLDKSGKSRKGFVLAEFTESATSTQTIDIGLKRLLTSGLTLHVPPTRPTVAELHIPSIESSLLAYHLEIEPQSCDKEPALFAPLVRQHLARPYESKFFVNVKSAEVSIHGVSPFVPPPLETHKEDKGIRIQVWTDPTCDSELVIKLRIDALGSLGKLYMRYRTVFAAFPLLIVVMVLAKQFQVYDQSGDFIPFAEGLDLCLRGSFPAMVLFLTLMSLWGWRQWGLPGAADNAGATGAIDFYENDSFTGTKDPLFWFLTPLIGIISIGVCVGFHYVTVLVTQVVAFVCSLLTWRAVATSEEKRRATSPVGVSSPSSPLRRLIAATVLLILVSTFIPYQLAYLVVSVVQLLTTARALRMSSIHRQAPNHNFYNYAHSTLLLMLWVLPINLPVLAVWLRNLAVQWLTPFASHHNILSIISFLLLVENMTSGRMVPRMKNRLRHVTTTLFLGTALYAGVYGMSYAYRLHHLVHIICTWLVLIYLTSDPSSLCWLGGSLRDYMLGTQKQGKAP